MEKINELSFAALKDLNKNEYFKLFKKPMPWKKAAGVLFLAKHKFSNGKVDLIAVPFRKYPEAAKCFKTEVKPSSTYTARLTLLCTLDQRQDEQGNLHFHFTPDKGKGGMNLDFLQAAAKDLFGRLSVGCSVEGAADEVEGDDLQELTEGTDDSLTPEEATEEAKALQLRATKADKIAQNLSQFEKALGKVEGAQLKAKLDLYNQTLTQLTKQATPEEQEQYKQLQQQVHATQEKVTHVDEAQQIVKAMRALLEQL